MAQPRNQRAPGDPTPRSPARNVVEFDEQRLADASIAGNERAFEQLYTHYYPKVRGFCLRKTSDPQLAEDIAQEAFARAFERISDFGGPKHFGGWVGTIASNLITDHYRRRYNDDVPLDHDEERGNAPVYEMNPVRRFQEDDTARLVRKALDKLDDRQRQAILMHEVRGLTCAAVGDHLGISEVAAESLLARARRRMRKELTRQMTARAAPAAIFNLGGIGLVPATFRAWRRLQEGIGRGTQNVRTAAAQGWTIVDQTTHGAGAVKALAAAVGTALIVQGAATVSSSDTPAPEAPTPPDAVETSAPVPTAEADGREDTSPIDVPPEDPVVVPVHPEGLHLDGVVEVPAPEEDAPGLGVDTELDVDPEGTPEIGGQVTVKDGDGDPVLDTGRVDIGGE